MDLSDDSKSDRESDGEMSLADSSGSRSESRSRSLSIDSSNQDRTASRGAQGAMYTSRCPSDKPSRHASFEGDGMSFSSSSSGGELPGAHEPRRQPLPLFGCFAEGTGMERFRMPFLWEPDPLQVVLQQVEGAAHLVGRRAAKLVAHGEEPCLKVYGTLRCFDATHRAAKVLTVRNQRELPSCLHFDPHFRSQASAAQLRELRFVTPVFGEWLLGLPRGWTALKPLGRTAFETNRKDLSVGAPGVFAGAPRAFRSLSVFSGCGALDYALPWCTPAGYCEKDPAAISVLQARMADNSLPEAPVFTDVRGPDTQECHCANRHLGGWISLCGSFPSRP